MGKEKYTVSPCLQILVRMNFSVTLLPMITLQLGESFGSLHLMTPLFLIFFLLFFFLPFLLLFYFYSFYKTESYFVAQAGLEFTMWLRLGNLQIILLPELLLKCQNSRHVPTCPAGYILIFEDLPLISVSIFLTDQPGCSSSELPRHLVRGSILSSIESISVGDC